MKFILNNLAIGSYEDALKPPSAITALLNVAKEKDIETTLLYHKVPIIDMQPIPPEQMKEAVEWIRDHIDRYSFGEAVEFVAKRKPDISILPVLIRTIEAAKSSIK